MSHSSLAAVLLVTVLVRVSRALPISPNNRFTIYTPYWHQSSQPRIPTEFIQKRPNCEEDLCGPVFDPLPPQRPEPSNSIPAITNMKRNKSVYKTGWTAGGMPFSVLYMKPKPQISVRSPMAEPLRSLPQIYDNSDFLSREPLQGQEARFNDFPSDVHAQPLTGGSAGPSVIPTRKQYSIIPQLFVSYGWRPLGN